MKTYVKPMIEFIELKPEERLACITGGTSKTGCCSNNNNSNNASFGWWCPKHYTYNKHCNKKKYYNQHCH